MPRAKHLPPFNFTELPERRLDALLQEFRQTYPGAFDDRPVGLGSKKIHPSLDGWQLAIRPEVWHWLVDRFSSDGDASIGLQRVAMIVAHWVINQRDHVGAVRFREWLIERHYHDRLIAIRDLTRWLEGEGRISANRCGGGGYAGTDATQAWWRRAKREHPSWASGKDTSLPHGYAKELAAEYYGTSDDFPESENGLEKLADRIAKALKRARKRHLGK